jgi:hypothetical protein
VAATTLLFACAGGPTVPDSEPDSNTPGDSGTGGNPGIESGARSRNDSSTGRDSGTGHGRDGGMGGSGGPIVCPGFSSTLLVPIAWGPDTEIYTNDFPPGFEATGALVVEFTTPAAPNPPPTSGSGSLNTINYTTSLAPRAGSLSATPCDFTIGITGQPGISTVFNSEGPLVPFTLGYVKTSSGHGGSAQRYAELQPNTTYYLNMYNPLKCPPSSTCDVRVTLEEPPGT